VPIDLIIYLAVAVVLVVWLRNTLGTKHGSEVDRSDILKRLKEQKESQAKSDSGKIIDISQRSRSESGDNSTNMDYSSRLSGLTIEGGADTINEITEFMRIYSDFDPKAFIIGAKDAFPMIVEAFAKADLKTLKMLLSEGVYDSFEEAIEARKSKGEIISTDVHAVRDCSIMGIKLIDRMSYIKLRFLAEETIVIRNKDGDIISGHPDKIVRMNDVWTFGRDTRSKDPTWYLFETSDDVPEEFKNPIPDTK